MRVMIPHTPSACSRTTGHIVCMRGDLTLAPASNECRGDLNPTLNIIQPTRTRPGVPLALNLANVPRTVSLPVARGHQAPLETGGKNPLVVPQIITSGPSVKRLRVSTTAVGKHSLAVPQIKTSGPSVKRLRMATAAPCHTIKPPTRSKMAATKIVNKYMFRTARSRPTLQERTAAMTSAPPCLSNPLGRHLSAWVGCNPCQWVLRTITHGYRMQFARRPPLTNKVLFTKARGQALVTLREEISALLAKNAIQEVNLERNPLGFYSKYFLVKKKQGGMRPILDLRCLNRYLKTFRFKMLTTSTLLHKVRRGTFWTNIDLKDAYFHVSIYPPHRKFLRFGFDNRVYEYTVLPFGLSLSPRVFTKCTQAAIAPLRSQGIRLDTYLDDWLISADSRREAVRHTETVVSHLTSLGFNLNFEKSVLIPSQQTTFLGVVLDSNTLVARLSQERINSLLSCVTAFRVGQCVPYKTCMKLSGLMASAIHLARLGRFYMRPFQRWMLSLRIPSSCGTRMVRVSEACARALQPWSRTFLSLGVRVGMVLSYKTITTDASLTGWGAVFEGRTAKGVWSTALRSAHINYLELMAVFLALQRFEPLVRGCHVRVRTDNTTTVCYINKQGGLHSPVLDRLARDLTLWCDTRLASIRASHIAGLLNSGADLLSRGGYWYGDWCLHQGVANQIWSRYGRPEVDLFASEENAKCSRFFSIKGSAPLGLDALAHDWPRELLYAFPPLELILPTLERIRLQGLSVLLVAPGWGSWRSETAPLLYDDPWRLPPLRDLLSQANGDILHPRPQDLNLWVWPVRG